MPKKKKKKVKKKVLTIDEVLDSDNLFTTKKYQAKAYIDGRTKSLLKKLGKQFKFDSESDFINYMIKDFIERISFDINLQDKLKLHIKRCLLAFYNEDQSDFLKILKSYEKNEAYTKLVKERVAKSGIALNFRQLYCDKQKVLRKMLEDYMNEAYNLEKDSVKEKLKRKKK